MSFAGKHSRSETMETSEQRARRRPDAARPRSGFLALFDPGEDADLAELRLGGLGLLLARAAEHGDDHLLRQRLGLLGSDLAELGDQRHRLLAAVLVGDLGEEDRETAGGRHQLARARDALRRVGATTAA